MHKSLSMETNIKANIKMVNSMEKESTHGLMDPAMRASSSKASDKVKEVGNPRR